MSQPAALAQASISILGLPKQVNRDTTCFGAPLSDLSQDLEEWRGACYVTSATLAS